VTAINVTEVYMRQRNIAIIGAVVCALALIVSSQLLAIWAAKATSRPDDLRPVFGNAIADADAKRSGDDINQIRRSVEALQADIAALSRRMASIEEAQRLPRSPDSVSDLRREISQLSRTVQDLQDRVRRLEVSRR